MMEFSHEKTPPAPNFYASGPAGDGDPATRRRHPGAFSFGEPVPVLSQREVFDYLEAMHNGRWYEPPSPSMGCPGSIGPGCITPRPSR